MNHLIECHGVTKAYGVEENLVEVLRGLSFNIQAGEFVTIVGPSGSGKSTIMNILGCLDVPTDGKYILESRDTKAMTDDELSTFRAEKIGFVFQSFNLLAASVIHNVALPLVYNPLITRGEREEYVREALEMAQFPEDRFGHLPSQLSGGQKQRVAIARALVHRPSIILADEPTGNLDSHTGEKIMETFKKINKEQGVTVILITHDAKLAKVGDKILTIQDGLLV